MLRERRHQLAGSMSGGEQQMLALARALMTAPKILLIDEPSVGLAPVLVRRTIDKIKELKDQYQLTVLMAEQNFTQAIRIADRGYVIVHGKIAFDGRIARGAQQQRAHPQILSGALAMTGTDRRRDRPRHHGRRDRGQSGEARLRRARLRRRARRPARGSRRMAACRSNSAGRGGFGRGRGADIAAFDRRRWRRRSRRLLEAPARGAGGGRAFAPCPLP